MILVLDVEVSYTSSSAGAGKHVWWMPRGTKRWVLCPIIIWGQNSSYMIQLKVSVSLYVWATSINYQYKVCKLSSLCSVMHWLGQNCRQLCVSVIVQINKFWVEQKMVGYKSSLMPHHSQLLLKCLKESNTTCQMTALSTNQTEMSMRSTVWIQTDGPDTQIQCIYKQEDYDTPQNSCKTLLARPCSTEKLSLNQSDPKLCFMSKSKAPSSIQVLCG